MTQRASVTIAIDCMGGDLGPPTAVAGGARALGMHPQLRLQMVGDTAILGNLIDAVEMPLRARVSLLHASEVVGMDEPPPDALRKKKQSSMRIAINQVQSGEADACVSAGNTGALMAIARFVLKTIPGVDRPAIISAVPAIGGHTHMLDLGANADCSAAQLFQFAIMGSVVAADIHGLARPRVGLLNIGVEHTKGNERIRAAAEMLEASSLNYIGFVEGNDIFGGEVDVVVSDGFSGNVALKTMEGAANMVARYIHEEFSRTYLRKAAAWFSMPVLQSLQAKLDPRRYNGASLVGLRGIVIKSHGGADEVAFGNAIGTALLEARKGVPMHIGESLALEIGKGKEI